MEVYMCLFLASVVPVAEAALVNFYDPLLCYILDGFLGVYGLFITAMFIKEKFFKSKLKTDDGIYSDLTGQDTTGYDRLRPRDPERGRTRGHDDTYTDLNPRIEGEYKELPVREVQTELFTSVYICLHL
ncbi:T-cell surface glycoprotein CD3 zeta chain, partial [Sphaeramia orbicularis]